MGSISFADNHVGSIYFAVCCALQVLAIFAVILRLWSRRLQKASLQLNDYEILIAVALSIGNMVVLALSVTCGMGMHILTIPIKDAMEFGKMQTIITLIWLVNLFAIKASILDLYIKIFRNRSFVRVCYAYLALQVLWVIGAILNTVLMCRPLAFWWDKTIPGGKCGSLLKSYYAAHIIIFILDFGLAMLPVPILIRLQMDTKRKISVIFMFSIGLVIGAFDLMRIAWREKIESIDVTYDYALLFAFTLLEAQLGIILASVPVMQPVVRKFTQSGPLARLRTIFGSTKGTAMSNSAPLTVGSKGNRIRLQKLDSETDSIKPLGTEELGHGAVDYRSPSEMEHNELGHHGHGSIQVTHTWDVRH